MKTTISTKHAELDPSVKRTVEPIEIILGLRDGRLTMRMLVEHFDEKGEKSTYIGDQLHEAVADRSRLVVVTDAKTMQYRDATPQDDPKKVLAEYDLIINSPVGQGLLQLVNGFVQKVISNDLLDSGAIRVR